MWIEPRGAPVAVNAALLRTLLDGGYTPVLTIPVADEKGFAFNEVFPKRALAIVRGEGATLYDESGRAYIDCAAGVGVASVGHSNPEVARDRGPGENAHHLPGDLLQRRPRPVAGEARVDHAAGPCPVPSCTTPGPRRKRRPSSSRCTRRAAAGSYARCAGSTRLHNGAGLDRALPPVRLFEAAHAHGFRSSDDYGAVAPAPGPIRSCWTTRPCARTSWSRTWTKRMSY